MSPGVGVPRAAHKTSTLVQPRASAFARPSAGPPEPAR